VRPRFGWMAGIGQKRGRRLPSNFMSWGADPDTDAEVRKRPTHGTVGPATRGFPCDGQCWDPNRFGMCRVCGGGDPRRVA